MMRFRNTTSDNYWWVVLLLAAAVILPTVCLLWFMTTAVRNERLIMRQKLVEMYSLRANKFFVEIPNIYYSGLAEDLNSSSIAEPRNYFWLFANSPDSLFQGMLIYDTKGNLLYPTIALQTEEPADQTIQPIADKSKKTIERVHQSLYPENPENVHPIRMVDVMRYKVFLAECFLETKDERLLTHLRDILGDHLLYDEGPAETIVWQLEKLIAIAARAGMTESLESEIQSANGSIAAYTNAFEAALLYPTFDRLDTWPDQTIRRLTPDKNLYGFKINIQNQTVLAISTQDKILNILTAVIKDMQDDTINIQITDNFGNLVFGNSDNTEKPFLTTSAGSFLPDFTVSVYFKDASVFDTAAGRQRLVYIWSVALVIVLMMVFASLAGREVLHQSRINRIKNNFVATVTHELKTPLSSMRLLVDTLLDGNYTNQQQCKEYLELISHENERLSRMIDSFLTFSRMERNKQVFDFQPVKPDEIVHAAAQAVLTKMNQPGCHFVASVDANLPPIRADKDAMVTVLVNLLDNAYKYSNPEKTIELTAYREDEMVCFAVKDNGIGIPRRIQKKIFDRFFQADNRLSRSAEGCGLGLSIVKFIVNAHKGQIRLESKPAQGSKFIVLLSAQQEGRPQ
jgi:signal transduction histidine kinase